jgi:hypothetical protein
MCHHESHHGFSSKWSEWSFGRKALLVVGGGIAGIGLLALFGFVVMWLWNWLMPKIFGLPQIGYWEGWGLLVLAKILFGGMRGSARSEDRRRKKKLRERMEAECQEGPPAEA